MCRDARFVPHTDIHQARSRLYSEIIARPWSKVGADLCESNGRTLLVMCDHYSNFIEVAHLKSKTSRCVIREMSGVFARFGLADILVTDNAPNFTSAEFAVFAKTWAFEHVTLSPHYPESNGKSETAVKTVKRLFKKCQYFDSICILFTCADVE